jgi:hypothetical protein
MNMFKKVKARTVKEYIDAVPEERRVQLLALDKFIRKTVPRLKLHFAYNMLGYGSFKYMDKKKKELKDWPVLSLANQKNYFSLYVCSIQDGKYLVESFKKELGQKVSVGKACIRFKRVEDLDLKGLAMVLKLAQKKPGLQP